MYSSTKFNTKEEVPAVGGENLKKLHSRTTGDRTRASKPRQNVK